MVGKRYAWAKSFIPESALRKTLFDDVVSTIPGGEAALNDDARKVIDAQVDIFCSPAYREMLRYDPADDIACIEVPWLALYGTKDTQVSAALNAGRLKELAAAKPNINIAELVDKNHLFQNAITGAIQEYDQINGSISDDVLQEILEWLLDNATR